MRTAIKTIPILFLLTLNSCCKTTFSTTPSIVNPRADSIAYKLTVVDDAKKDYFFDEKGLNDLLVVNTIMVNDSNFGATENIPKAIVFAKSINKNAGVNFRKVTTISIARKDKKNIPIWKWENPINLNDDGFSFREGHIDLEEASRDYKGSFVNCLKINFKQPDDGEGFKIYSLIFTAKNENWILVSRERISTVVNDVSNDKIGFCVDTVNSSYNHPGKTIQISKDMMFDFNGAKCY
ncbi:hypothetical protein [Flavobacterium sp.]|uniref:hypothetical protein n=1 Tax=Flavobacterium sp. TaxID=239 RepID=UPI0039E59C7E